MKTLILVTLVGLTIGCSNAQNTNETEVPAVVKESFAKKYPNAKVEKWEKEDSGDFEAEFDLNKVEASAVFNDKGEFMEEEKEIKTKQLPAGVSEYCKTNYDGWKLTEASQIMDASNKITFEAEMTKGKEHFDALFDADGNFLKKLDTKPNEEEDED